VTKSDRPLDAAAVCLAPNADYALPVLLRPRVGWTAQNNPFCFTDILALSHLCAAWCISRLLPEAWSRLGLRQDIRGMKSTGLSSCCPLWVFCRRVSEISTTGPRAGR
jgi:hypothetical protein